MAFQRKYIQSAKTFHHIAGSVSPCLPVPGVTLAPDGRVPTSTGDLLWSHLYCLLHAVYGTRYVNSKQAF